MFGTIAHATVKTGQQAKVDSLMEEWRREIRPKIPGPVVELVGHRAGQPDQTVVVVLTQDEATYRKMAELPEQHQLYLRLQELLIGEPSWDDVEMEWGLHE